MKLLNQKEVYDYAFYRACGFSVHFSYAKVVYNREKGVTNETFKF
jgi:hypothetical protein